VADADIASVGHSLRTVVNFTIFVVRVTRNIFRVSRGDRPRLTLDFALHCLRSLSVHNPESYFYAVQFKSNQFYLSAAENDTLLKKWNGQIIKY